MHVSTLRFARRSVLAVGLGLALASPSGATSGFDFPRFERPLQVIGLTEDQQLVVFWSSHPQFAFRIGALRGFAGGDTRLVGIDYRANGGRLWGLGDAGGIYEVDDRTAGLIPRARLDMALSGASFGVDFNPAADRLRIVSDTGQNLRVVPDTGVTTMDGTLTYAATPPVPGVGIVGAAYTNNDADTTTGTTLFDLDTVLDQIAIQSPPNAGSLVATGKLGVDAVAEVGFDIYSRQKDGTTVDNSGFASIPSAVDGQTRFYSVDLLTGRVSSLGRFRQGHRVIDVAVPLDQR